VIALVTGATGQDGIYLSRLLAATGVEVLAGVRPEVARLASPARHGRRLAYLAHQRITPVPLDVTDTAAFAALLRARQIDEVYHLAAVSSVARSWEDPRTTAAVNADAVEGMLAAVRHVRPTTRFFQASSVQAGPSSPYAAAKLAAEGSVSDARRRGVFAVAGRLANHESPLRPPDFVSRRIARAAASGAVLDIGSLSPERDWAHARDHVAAMPLLLRLPEPLDADICTGVRQPLRSLAHAAYRAAGLSPDEYVVETDTAARPADPISVGGSPDALRRATGWRARTSVAELMAEMVAVERRRLASGIEDDVDYIHDFEGPR
jgi:GDPmannose 4,6-dehydratase